MNYRDLGRTRIKVSEIGMGGEAFENKSYEYCEELIDFAIEKGINFFDIYNSNPQVRENVGKALSKYPRENFVIEGHLGTTWENNQYKRTRDMQEVIRSYEEFLGKMQLNYVDVGMIHYIDDDKDFDNIFKGAILEYAMELKNKGIIKSLGISTHNTEIAFRAVESGIIDVILFSLNPAYDMLPPSEDVNILFEEDTFKGREYRGIDPRRDELYKVCQNKGVALTVMKGFAAGLLLNDKKSPFGKALTAVQCLHYCLTRPSVASVVAGLWSKEQILEAVSYSKASDKEKDFSEIISKAPKSSFDGHCMYCGHCAPCTKNIDIALANKYVDLYAIQEEKPETLKEHYRLLEHHGGECIECGICLKNCPFNVKIINKMKEAVEFFGY